MFNHHLSLLRYNRILAEIQTPSSELAEFSTMNLNSANRDISRKFLQSTLNSRKHWLRSPTRHWQDRAKAYNTYIAPQTATAAAAALLLSQTEGVQPIGRKLTPRSRTLICNKTAVLVCRLMVSTQGIYVITYRVAKKVSSVINHH